MDGPDDGAQRARLDALRHRLYAPGADDDDLTRYRTAVAAVPAPPPPAPPAPPRSRWRQRLAGPVVVLAAALVAVAALPLLPARERVEAAPTASPDPGLPVPAAVREGFVQSLARTASPDVATWLLTHRAAQPPALAGATRVRTEEHYGIGPGSIGLSPDAAADSAGRMTVVVLLDRGDELRWEASRLAVRSDHRQYRQVVADRDLRLAAGAPVAATFRYDHGAPRALSVVVTQEVRWDVVVAFTD